MWTQIFIRLLVTKFGRKHCLAKPKSYDLIRRNKINKENQRDKNNLKLIEVTPAEKCNGEKNI